MGFYENLITFLYLKLQKPEEKTKSNQLKDYYNLKYPSKPIFYNGRVLPNSQKRIRVDVRDFFTLQDETLKSIANNATQGISDDNSKALALLKWIITNISYITDKKQFNLPEYWDFPFETLATCKNDCEGMSILLANLLIISGIPNWKVRVNAGMVFEPFSKKLVGHAYVSYFDETTEQWKILDCCYYPNIKKISERKEYKKEEMYRDIWFSFNDEYSFAKSNGDVRKMNDMDVK